MALIGAGSAVTWEALKVNDTHRRRKSNRTCSTLYTKSPVWARCDEKILRNVTKNREETVETRPRTKENSRNASEWSAANEKPRIDWKEGATEKRIQSHHVTNERICGSLIGSPLAGGQWGGSNRLWREEPTWPCLVAYLIVDWIHSRNIATSGRMENLGGRASAWLRLVNESPSVWRWLGDSEHADNCSRNQQWRQNRCHWSSSTVEGSMDRNRNQWRPRLRSADWSAGTQMVDPAWFQLSGGGRRDETR